MTADALDSFRTRLLAPFETALATACAQAATRRTEEGFRQLAGAIRSSPLTTALPAIQQAAAEVESVPLRSLDEKANHLLALLRQVLGKETATPRPAPAAAAPPPVDRPTTPLPKRSSPSPTTSPLASGKPMATPPPPPSESPKRNVPPPPTESPSVTTATPSAPAPPAPLHPTALQSEVEAQDSKETKAAAVERHSGLLTRFRHANDSQTEPLPVAVIAANASQVDRLRGQLPLTAAIGEWTDTHYVLFFPHRTVPDVLALLEPAIASSSMQAGLGAVPSGYDLSPLVERLIAALPGPGKVKAIEEELAQEEDGAYYVVVAAEDDALASQLTDRLGRLGFIVHRSPDAVDLLQVAHRIVPDLIVLELQNSHVDGANVVTRVRQIRGFHDVPIIINGGAAPEEYEGAGLVDVLVTPLGPQDLALRARRLAKDSLI